MSLVNWHYKSSLACMAFNQFQIQINPTTFLLDLLRMSFVSPTYVLRIFFVCLSYVLSMSFVGANNFLAGHYCTIALQLCQRGTVRGCQLTAANNCHDHLMTSSCRSILIRILVAIGQGRRRYELACRPLCSPPLSSVLWLVVIVTWHNIAIVSRNEQVTLTIHCSVNIMKAHTHTIYPRMHIYRF